MYNIGNWTENIYEDFWKVKNCLISINIQKNQHVTKKQMLDKMKDERKRILITEFVGLTSKMYSFVTDKND